MAGIYIEDFKVYNYCELLYINRPFRDGKEGEIWKQPT